ncbi:guanine deaminase (plasmid) [Streptoverticillium reticulum]|uniref:guanine deaminase n=1 Tax=Streptoverticillium reticulum TaxID=1433415 RepID=UPI0039BFE399
MEYEIPEAQHFAALRGTIVYFIDDPFLVGKEKAFVCHEDGLLIAADGIIKAVGPYVKIKSQLPVGVEIEHYEGHIISAGFIDSHVHYVQTGMIGSYGEQLIDWLNNYTFIEEQKLKDPAAAREMSSVFCDELLRNGTTTAFTFAAVYPHTVDALLEETERRNMRMIAGKIMMDRNAPAALLDDAQSSYEDSKELIQKWNGRGRQQYAITPRFAPTSTPAQLEAASALWREYPEVHVHSHVSENLDELAWVKELFPEHASYLDVYDHYNLVGRRSLYAHGVHLNEAEMRTLHEREAAIAHCPTSNNFLGSGHFPLREAKRLDRPVHVGLGTDIGAGTSFSMLATMNEAYKVAQLRSYSLQAVNSFFLATLGGARSLDIDDKVGTLAPGHEADIVVLNPRATKIMDVRMQRVSSIEDVLFVLGTMGDDRSVKATYIAGKKTYGA